jgi:hypothetical protein
LYTDDPRDLSRAPTLEAFLQRYRLLIKNCAGALESGGKLAVLMGLGDCAGYVVFRTSSERTTGKQRG